MADLQQLSVVNAVAVESGPVQMNVQPPGLYLDQQAARFLALDLVLLMRAAEGQALRGNPYHIAREQCAKLVRLIEEQVTLPRAAAPEKRTDNGPAA